MEIDEERRLVKTEIRKWCKESYYKLTILQVQHESLFLSIKALITYFNINNITMGEYILKLNLTQIDPPPSKKVESRDFPRAKVRTTTPSCRNSLIDFNFKSRPQTPKPTKIMMKNSLLSKVHRNSNARKKVNTFYRRKSISEILESSYFAIGKSSDLKKNKNFRIKSPTRVLAIPYTSLKIG